MMDFQTIVPFQLTFVSTRSSSLCSNKYIQRRHDINLHVGCIGGVSTSLDVEVNRKGDNPIVIASLVMRMIVRSHDCPPCV
jgi:hypothetical protein